MARLAKATPIPVACVVVVSTPSASQACDRLVDFAENCDTVCTVSRCTVEPPPRLITRRRPSRCKQEAKRSFKVGGRAEVNPDGRRAYWTNYTRAFPWRTEGLTRVGGDHGAQHKSSSRPATEQSTRNHRLAYISRFPLHNSTSMPIATPIVGRSSPVETNRGSWDLKQLQLEGNEGGPVGQRQILLWCHAERRDSRFPCPHWPG